MNNRFDRETNRSMNNERGLDIYDTEVNARRFNTGSRNEGYAQYNDGFDQRETMRDRNDRHSNDGPKYGGQIGEGRYSEGERNSGMSMDGYKDLKNQGYARNNQRSSLDRFHRGNSRSEGKQNDGYSQRGMTNEGNHQRSSEGKKYEVANGEGGLFNKGDRYYNEPGTSNRDYERLKNKGNVKDGYDWNSNEDLNLANKNARFSGGPSNESRKPMSNDAMGDVVVDDNALTGPQQQKGRSVGGGCASVVPSVVAVVENRASKLPVEDSTATDANHHFFVNPLRGMLIPGKIVEVVIRSAPMEPFTYFVVMKKHLKAINEVNSITDAYLSKFKTAVRNPQVGNLVGAFFDRKWYRAEVLDTNGKQGIIAFLEFGDKLEVALNELTELPSFLTICSPFAFKIKLVGSTPIKYDHLDYDDCIHVKIVSSVDENTFEVAVVPDENKAYLEDLVREKKAVPLTRMDLIKLNVPLKFFITHSIGNKFYWMLLDIYDGELTEFTSKLSKCNLKSLDSKQLVPGTIAVAMWQDDGWFRCRVEKKIDGKKVDVFFFDYGNTETVDCDEIRTIPREFLDELPYVVKVKLPDNCLSKYTNMTFGEKITVVAKSKVEDYLKVEIIEDAAMW